jgi:hypothetical protein
MHWHPHVTGADELDLAAVHAHPDAYLTTWRPALREDRSLPVDGRRHRGRRLVERHEHRVTLGLDDDAAVDRENGVWSMYARQAVPV